MGVPTLACHCAVCESPDPRDKRTRPSILLAFNGHHVVIDTTPDFRFQAMREKLDRLDAVLLHSRPRRPHSGSRRHTPLQFEAGWRDSDLCL